MLGCSAFSALTVGAVLAATPTFAGTTTYIFKKPSDAKGWSSVTQNWTVRNKAYGPVITEDTYPIAVLDQPSFAMSMSLLT
jgi:hypothetical protein